MKNKKQIQWCLLLYPFILCNLVWAQLPVDKEPHHKEVFQNEYVRILEGRIPAHDTTPVHLHARNSVIVFLSKSVFGIRVPGENPVVTQVSPGDLKYAPYGDKPVNHIVWNQGIPLFHFLVVELKKQPSFIDTNSLLAAPGLKFEWQQKSVRSYHLDIDTGKAFNLPASNNAYFLVVISGQVTSFSGNNNNILKEGRFIFFAPRTKIGIHSKNENAKCVLLELN